MSAQPSALRITTPSGLVAACPALLGFSPESGSLVGLISGVPFRTAPVTLRADVDQLPPGSQQVVSLAASMANTGGRQVDLVCFADVPDDLAREDLPTAWLVCDLVGRLFDTGMVVGLAVTTNGRSWWSHECDGPCCPSVGTALDLAEMDLVVAEFVFAGMAPMASRDELRPLVAHDPVRAPEVARELGRQGIRAPSARQSTIEAWRDESICTLDSLLLPAPAAAGSSSTPAEPVEVAPGDASSIDRLGGRLLTDSEIASLVAGLADVPVRDTMVRRLALTPEPHLRHARDVLAEAVRVAPQGHVAPAATLLALTAWSIGEGALANLALDRAQADDARYTLAGLARRMMAGGMNPQAWRVGVAGLGEDRCRNQRERP